MVQLHSSRLLEARGGRLADPEREMVYEDAERLRDALQRGEEKVFSVGLYILLRASSLATTKISRFAGSRIARSIIGQPRSTIAPSDWLRSGAIVVVNTAKG